MSAQARGRLGHSLILQVPRTASENLGNSGFLMPLFRKLLCLEIGSEEACGNCESCRVELSLDPDRRRHPDFFVVVPQGEQGYAIEQVRDWTPFFSMRPNLGANKVFVLTEADRLSGGSASSSNALLKILEEPRANNYLILVTDKPLKLISTIHSRCLMLNLTSDAIEHLSSQKTTRAKSTATESATDEILRTLQGQLVETPSLSSSAYWKKRNERLRELETSHSEVWRRLRDGWSDLTRIQSIELWSRWHHFDAFLAAVARYGNGPNHWLHFKMKIKEGLLWKPSR